ncbi:MAG: 1-acyl-sn-glycerol-3-phosphate acyltransferase [Clostridia bacterium]|nr:1-acyl-sn-glycerol-3-phosphate acyltransferase [Clostridia bacterium]
MNKFLRFTVSWVKYLVRPFFPVKFFGDSKIPTKKLLLMGNHLSAMDPVVQALYTKEVPSYVYKSELAKSKFLKWIFDGLDLIPVNRGESDLHATRQIMRRLKDNRVVGIFPKEQEIWTLTVCKSSSMARCCSPSKQKRPSSPSTYGTDIVCSFATTSSMARSSIFPISTTSPSRRNLLPKHPSSFGAKLMR